MIDPISAYVRYRARIYIYNVRRDAGFVTLFVGDIRGMRKLRRELLIHDHYGAREGMSRMGAKGCAVEVTRAPGTKQDVNLARKTLFSPGKVVNGRLGSRSR